MKRFNSFRHKVSVKFNLHKAFHWNGRGRVVSLSPSFIKSKKHFVYSKNKFKRAARSDDHTNVWIDIEYTRLSMNLCFYGRIRSCVITFALIYWKLLTIIVKKRKFQSMTFLKNVFLLFTFQIQTNFGIRQMSTN